jgi:hypothetical protein
MAYDDPARGVRRLLTVLLVLALAAAGGAFALSQRGGGISTSPQPSLFPARFSEAGFLSGEVTLVTSYDAATNARRVTGTVEVRGTAYVVARCRAGTIRLDVSGLTSSRPCTGQPVGVVALQLTRTAQLTATVTLPQSTRWGVAIYR